MAKPNIALVHEWITNIAGSEKVLLVLKEMFPEAPIYTAVFDKKKAALFSKFEIHTSFLQKLPFFKSKRELLIPFTPFAFEQFDLGKYDVVISSTTMAAKGVITKPGTIHISYCHTPPRYLWEPNLDPRASKGWFKNLRQNTIHKMRIWDRLAADRVDYFLANSRHTAARIKKYYRRDATVIYPPVDISKFTLAAPDQTKDYFLFVSRLVDYKKCDIVIQAFNKLGWPLKVVGYGPDSAKLKKMAKDNIEFLGGKFGENLSSIYQGAKALVFAAEEDFGIVPVEAMACGKPVICYSRGGQTESVIDGETGLFFTEQSADSIIEILKKFDSSKFDPIKIRQQAEKFSKEKFKENFLKAIKVVVPNHFD